jgi:hypothetical protein
MVKRLLHPRLYVFHVRPHDIKNLYGELYDDADNYIIMLWYTRGIFSCTFETGSE